MSVVVRTEEPVWAEALHAPFARRKGNVMVTYAGPEDSESVIDELGRAGLSTNSEILFAVPRSMIPMSASIRRSGRFSKSWYLSTHSLPGIGLVADEATRIARFWGADLILVGSTGSPNIEPPYFGCNSPGVAERAHCSVRIARRCAPRAGSTPQLLVGVDGSPGATATIREVAERAWMPGTAARIVVVEEPALESPWRSHTRSAWDTSARGSALNPSELRLALDEAAEALRTAGLVVSREFRRGDPAIQIVEAARDWGADCIFVGSRGLGRDRVDGETREGLGAVARALAQRAPFSVEIVRESPALARTNPGTPQRSDWTAA